MIEEIKIVDDFFPDIEKVIPLLEEVPIGDQPFFGKVYTGVGPVTLPVQFQIMKAVQRPIRITLSHLRIGTAKTPLTNYIHADGPAGDFAAVIHFTEPDCYTGTAFWKNLRTGEDRLRADVTEEEFAEYSKETSDESFWRQTAFVGAKKNRACIFKSNLFHSRSPKDLPIQDGETPRMVYTVMFNLS